MIKVYTENDLMAVVKAYVRFREIDGLSRDTAIHGAVQQTIQQAELRRAVTTDPALKAIDASRRQTDKLTPLGE